MMAAAYDEQRQRRSYLFAHTKLVKEVIEFIEDYIKQAT